MKEKTNLFHRRNWLFLGVFLVLSAIFLALAWKDPFKQNNLISNLEPFPDTFYYSVPVWNWLHGDGYKMAYEGMEIAKDVPPLYGFYLTPFFKIFDDVRSYYFANMILCFGSILLFVRLVSKFYEKSKIRWWLTVLTGFILVTNFYFYNLPTLLMAENLQIFLILSTVNVMLSELSMKYILGTILLSGLLWFSKKSNFPIIVLMIFWLGVKILLTKFWGKYNRKVVVIFSILLVIILGLFIYKVIYPNIFLLTIGTQFFSVNFVKKFLPVYLSEFLGKNGHYLWYFNQQIENIAGFLAVFGIVIGLFWKKYRENTLILLSVILATVVFHSFLYFPEGRYISVVIPLYIIFIGMIPEFLSKVKLGVVSVVVIGLLYLGIRQNINNFPDRKITSIKRQVMDNQREENEVPWNYIAIENFNKFFEKEDENVYLGTLLPVFNYMYFGNGHYKYLPISSKQEFGEGRGLLVQMYGKYANLMDYYEYLLRSGKKVYVTNYFMENNPGLWPIEFKKIEDKFALRQLADGCMGICKIYEVELKK